MMIKGMDNNNDDSSNDSKKQSRFSTDSDKYSVCDELRRYSLHQHKKESHNRIKLTMIDIFCKNQKIATIILQPRLIFNWLLTQLDVILPWYQMNIFISLLEHKYQNRESVFDFLFDIVGPQYKSFTMITGFSRTITHEKCESVCKKITKYVQELPPVDDSSRYRGHNVFLKQKHIHISMKEAKVLVYCQSKRDVRKNPNYNNKK